MHANVQEFTNDLWFNLLDHVTVYSKKDVRKVCAALGCEVQDIVDFLPDEKTEKNIQDCD